MLMNKTEYWLMNNPARSGMLRWEASKVRRMSPAQNLEHALEIGCGQGQGTKNIIRQFNPKHIDAIDLDPKMIARAKRRVTDSRVMFQVGDAANISFATDNTYDAIFDFGIIHHIPNWKDCLKELHRVLKPDGYLHIEDLSIESFTEPAIGRFLKLILDHPYNKMYKKTDFDKELKRLSFEVVKSSDWEGYAFWRVARKSQE